MKTDAEIREIAKENRDKWAGRKLIAIVEAAGGYEVHEHTVDSVWPVSTHLNKRLAAARVLQLLEIGPVAPQMHPEEATISLVDQESENGTAE